MDVSPRHLRRKGRRFFLMGVRMYRYLRKRLIMWLLPDVRLEFKFFQDEIIRLNKEIELLENEYAILWNQKKRENENV